MYKVIVIDDEMLVRRGIVMETDWQGLNCVVVAEAGNGIEGLEAVRKYHPDLLICDIRMPKMDGIEMLKELRAEGNDVSVIFLTAYSDFSYAQSALKLFASDYLLKPFGDGELDWAPTYLKEVKGYDIKEIGWAYFSYEFAAIPGTIFCGWLSDKVFKGRRAITTMIYMVAVAIFVFVYWEFSKTPLMDSICLIAIGFLIYGPVMLIGVHALDLAPKKAAGTAAGFTGFFGYFFGTALFANIGLGYVVQNLGWNWNFIVLLVACALAFIFIGFTAKEEQYLVKQAKQ